MSEKNRCFWMKLEIDDQICCRNTTGVAFYRKGFLLKFLGVREILVGKVGGLSAMARKRCISKNS